MTNLILYTTVILYFVALIAHWRCYRADSVMCRIMVTAAAWAAVLMHADLLHQWIDTPAGQNLTVANLFSMVFWLGNASVLCALWRKPVATLLTFTLPLAAISILVVHFSQQSFVMETNQSWSQLAHILLSIASVSVLSLGVLQALLVTIQERRLRSRTATIFNAFPPLETMENLLFQIIGLGCVLLFLTLMMGFVFWRQSPNVHFSHQIGLSILALLMFTGLLFGRNRFGWRGRFVLYLTLASFLVLLIAYGGSLIL